MPEDMPDQGDRRVVFFDPPPPPPPPLPKENLEPQQAKPDTPKPVANETKPRPEFTAPIQTPQPQEARLEPEAGVRAEDQFGSPHRAATSATRGDGGGRRGRHGRGRAGRCSRRSRRRHGDRAGDGLRSPPRPIKQTKPVIPPGGLRQEDRGHRGGRDPDRLTGQGVRARVVQSVPLLDAAALQTVYQWVFQLAVKHGRPVATIAHIPVTFRISLSPRPAPSPGTPRALLGRSGILRAPGEIWRARRAGGTRPAPAVSKLRYGVVRDRLFLPERPEGKSLDTPEKAGDRIRVSCRRGKFSRESVRGAGMEKRLFEDLIDSDRVAHRTQQSKTMPVSLLLHLIAAGLIVIVPLLAADQTAGPGVRGQGLLRGADGRARPPHSGS